MEKLPEVWLRGPLPEINPYLQPVAHALMQAKEEIHLLLDGFPKTKLWLRPAGVASVGFHLKHIVGVLDRLLTYAKGNQLDEEQLVYLKNEEQEEIIQLDFYLELIDKQIERTLSEISNWNTYQLTDKREVGRAKLPSTVLGLLFHAGEHTMRHVGQISVTTRILLSEYQ